MIGLGPDHAPATTSLLRARRQQLIIATPLGAGVATVGSVLRRKTLGPLRAPTWRSTHPVPPPLPGRVDHHKVAHRLQPRALLVELGPETNGLLCRRRVATVARRCGRKVEDRRNVDCLYCRLACVRRTTGMDDVTNRRRCKRTISCALQGRRASHRRATPTEDRDNGARRSRKESKTYREGHSDEKFSKGTWCGKNRWWRRWRWWLQRRGSWC